MCKFACESVHSSIQYFFFIVNYSILYIYSYVFKCICRVAICYALRNDRTKQWLSYYGPRYPHPFQKHIASNNTNQSKRNAYTPLHRRNSSSFIANVAVAACAPISPVKSVQQKINWAWNWGWKKKKINKIKNKK